MSSRPMHLLPGVFDALWTEHGSDLKQAQIAADEAAAVTSGFMPFITPTACRLHERTTERCDCDGPVESFGDEE